MQRDPQNIVRGVVKVASLPMIYLKLEEAINDVATSNQHIAAILGEDTALSARLLRLSNSAMFGFPSKISTIQQAITIIGTRQLRDLVLASSVVAMFKDIPDELVSMESFWRHSIACAVAARILAGHRRDTNVESAFVSGLLHDIGRLMLFKELPQEMGGMLQQCQQHGSLLHVVEQQQLGFDHALLGGLLLKEWKLPSQLVESCSKHHAPMQAKTFPMEAGIVHVADIIANGLEFGSSGEHLVPPLVVDAWLQLGLPTGIIDSVINLLNQQYSVAVDFVLGGAG